MIDANQVQCPQHPDRAQIDAGQASEPWKGMYSGTHHFILRRHQGKTARTCLYCKQTEAEVRAEQVAVQREGMS